MKSPRRFLNFAICAATLSSSLHLVAGTVMNTANSGDGSLRNILAAAVNGETIDFAPALNGATITLTTGELSISGKQVTIDASAIPNGIKISGNASSRIFAITTGSNVTLNNLEIINGKILSDNGGGIAASQSQLNCTNVAIRNCVSAFDGGGLWANSVTGNFDRCSYQGNDSGSYGGGIFLIGATVSTFKNSEISGNRAQVGGGIAALSSSPVITNCTIQGNSGSGIQLEFTSAPNLRNTIVWGNRIGEGSLASQQIRPGSSSSAVANVDYCLIEGAPSILNNLDGTLPANNPNFIDPATPLNSTTPPSTHADLRVFTNSPILNVGDNGSNSTSFDLAGKMRIQAGTIDLGAYETGYVNFAFLHPALSQTEDANGNGLSNFLEYATGLDPTAPHDFSVNPVFSINEGFKYLTTSYRTNGSDVIAVWETSTNLEALSWQNMVSGIHYTVESTSSLTPNRLQVVLKLLEGGSRRFYRQGFTNDN